MTNENRLIYANEAYEIARESGRHSDFARSRADLTSLEEVLEECTAVPAVEVVRCKDCKYSHDHEINRNYRCHRHARDGYSQVFDATFTDNDFCSYGERKHNG